MRSLPEGTRHVSRMPAAASRCLSSWRDQAAVVPPSRLARQHCTVRLKRHLQAAKCSPLQIELACDPHLIGDSAMVGRLRYGGLPCVFQSTQMAICPFQHWCPLRQSRAFVFKQQIKFTAYQPAHFRCSCPARMFLPFDPPLACRFSVHADLLPLGAGHQWHAADTALSR